MARKVSQLTRVPHQKHGSPIPGYSLVQWYVPHCKDCSSIFHLRRSVKAKLDYHSTHYCRRRPLVGSPNSYNARRQLRTGHPCFHAMNLRASSCRKEMRFVAYDSAQISQRVASGMVKAAGIPWMVARNLEDYRRIQSRADDLPWVLANATFGHHYVPSQFMYLTGATAMELVKKPRLLESIKNRSSKHFVRSLEVASL